MVVLATTEKRDVEKRLSADVGFQRRSAEIGRFFLRDRVASQMRSTTLQQTRFNLVE